jgi:hypothetical protein
MANGRRVVLDGAKSTRHIIAGLAQALAGVLCSGSGLGFMVEAFIYIQFLISPRAQATSSQDWHRHWQVRCC